MTDKSVVNKQKICPDSVNTALQKLTKINPFYSNITIHNEREDLSEQSDPVLWKLLTIVYRKTDDLEVDCYVLLFLKVC